MAARRGSSFAAEPSTFAVEERESVGTQEVWVVGVPDEESVWSVGRTRRLAGCQERTCR